MNPIMGCNRANRELGPDQPNSPHSKPKLVLAYLSVERGAGSNRPYPYVARQVWWTSLTGLRSHTCLKQAAPSVFTHCSHLSSLAVSPPDLTHKKNVLARSAGISVERGAGSNRPYPYVAHPWGHMTCYLCDSETTFTPSSHHW